MAKTGSTPIWRPLMVVFFLAAAFVVLSLLIVVVGSPRWERFLLAGGVMAAPLYVITVVLFLLAAVRHQRERRARERTMLESLSPTSRDELRLVLNLERAGPDAIASELFRYGDDAGGGWADIIDMLTLNPELRWEFLETLVEIDDDDP